jgi:hypothetical protein
MRSCGGVAVPPELLHTYTRLFRLTPLTVICEMSCEQNTLVAAVVKVIELALYITISSVATHNVVSSVVTVYVPAPSAVNRRTCLTITGYRC